jgi:dihydrolipoamide dehydrogenase
MDTTTYDVVVIGAGPVGENIADRVAQGGLSAAIVATSGSPRNFPVHPPTRCANTSSRSDCCARRSGSPGD